jgi:hypothetical protein
MSMLSQSVEDQPTGQPGIDPLLVKAGRDVRHIISHVARNGKSLDDADVKAALELVEKIEVGTPLAPEQEVQFWRVYANLVKEALPARVEALYYRDYVDVPSAAADGRPEFQRIRRQEEILRSIRKLSIVAFGLALVMLAYLSISEGIIQRNAALEDEFLKLTAGVMKGTRLETIAGVPAVKLAGSGGSGEASPPQSSTDTKSPPAADANLLALIDATKAQIASLINFNDATLRVLQLGIGKLEKQEGQASPLNGSVLALQQSINALISKYLLAVVAALLGVTVFILRSASANIQALSFRWYESGIYSNRLALGVIGGIAISWFAVRDTTGILGSITPAALAFLVGYSVEVLYNILDSLVKALGGQEKA